MTYLDNKQERRCVRVIAVHFVCLCVGVCVWCEPVSVRWCVCETRAQISPTLSHSSCSGVGRCLVWGLAGVLMGKGAKLLTDSERICLHPVPTPLTCASRAAGVEELEALAHQSASVSAKVRPRG